MGSGHAWRHRPESCHGLVDDASAQILSVCLAPLRIRCCVSRMRSSMYASRSRCSGASHVASRASGCRVRGLRMAARLVLRASSAARCARADGRLAPTCQSRTSMGKRVISPVWPAAVPSRVAVCNDRGEFAKSKSGVGPPYWGGRNGLRSLAILPSQTTISSATILARGGYTACLSYGCGRDMKDGRYE